MSPGFVLYGQGQNNMNTTSHTNRTCSSLGLMDDVDTSLGFPSNWNYCHRSSPIAPPRFKHQEEFCLGGKHGQCPIFLNQLAVPLPKDLRIPRSLSEVTRKKFRRSLVIVLMFFLVILGVGWGMAPRGLFPMAFGKITWTASPFSPLMVTTSTDVSPTTIIFPLIATMTSIPTSTSIPTDTVMLAVTPISTPSKNQLEVLIGTDYKFVIHKILVGETMNQFAAKYDTSVEAIVAINYTKRNPGWSGTLLVIPVGFTDTTKLPSFVVYQVQEKDRGISVEKMAKYLRVTPLDLKYYNGWTNDGDRPLVGDFLLVPRSRIIQ